MGIILGTATAAHAADFGECPGVVTESAGHYVLTTDATCDLSLLSDGAYVDLAGFTLYTTNSLGTGKTSIRAHDVTLADGNLRTNGIYWVTARGRLDRVDVSAIDPVVADGFFIEAGWSFTVTESHFHDLPNAIAIDFFFGGNGRVSDSRFTQTRIGVSVQGSSGHTIERSHFDENQIGLRLWNEDWVAVNDILVANNTFRDNTTTGVRVSAYTHGRARTFDNVQIFGNRIFGNAGPGMDVTLHCRIWEGDCAIGQTSVAITANQFKDNGFGPGPGARAYAADPSGAGHSSEVAHRHGELGGVGEQPGLAAQEGIGGDGITAKTLIGWGPSIVTATQGLWVFTLADNKTSKNADRGFDVAGVTDGGGNRSLNDTSTEPCLGVTCN